MKRLIRNSVVKKNGFSLLEVIVAVTFAIIVIGALTVLGVTTLKQVNNSRSRTQALELTKEGLEAIRSIRDNQAMANTATGSEAYVVCNRVVSPSCNCTAWQWSLVANCPWRNSYFRINKNGNNWYLEAVNAPAESGGNLNTAYEVTAGEGFFRQIRFADGASANEKLITVKVFWQDRRQVYFVENSTILTAWK